MSALKMSAIKLVREQTDVMLDRAVEVVNSLQKLGVTFEPRAEVARVTGFDLEEYFWKRCALEDAREAAARALVRLEKAREAETTACTVVTDFKARFAL